MDPVWIAVAFLLGFLVKQVGLPPLVGFLAAGFVLQAFGVESTETLDQIADTGIYLLLFSIGLKLRLRSLLRPEIWATASLHMAVTVLLFGGVIFAVATAGLSIFAELDLAACALIAFAASFSSTVFAVKVLEGKGEMDARHGRISIGILIMQDLFAVIFLTVTAGTAPSPWAFALLGLLVVKPLVFLILNRSGHGELLVLLGWLLPLAGAALFAGSGLKPDLGALVLGVLLATHPKAGELSKALLSFKDLFLVGFFLTIGLSGAPTLSGFGIAALFVLLLPVKVMLFYVLLTRFRLRARTATLGSLSLANYSEFGLIVGAVGAANGWISGEWLVILAIALAISFVLASPLNIKAQDIYQRWCVVLRRFENDKRLPEDQPVSVGDAEIVIVGMGRVGAGAYDEISRQSSKGVLGVDFDAELVSQHRQAGRNVILGDATDSDFWARVEITDLVKVAVLSMGRHWANIDVVTRLRTAGFEGVIAATARHPDEVAELRAAGVNAALDFYAEAGTGLAEHAYEAFASAGVYAGQIQEGRE